MRTIVKGSRVTMERVSMKSMDTRVFVTYFSMERIVHKVSRLLQKGTLNIGVVDIN